MIRLLFLLCISMPVFAAIDVYEFDTPEQEQRFRTLGYELRCPMCQNQSIGDSDADISHDMRARVHQMILEGKTDAEIVDFFVQRYGDFVSYRPPVNSRTVILWLVPGLMFVLGAAGVAVMIVRASRRVDDDDDEEDQVV